MTFKLTIWQMIFLIVIAIALFSWIEYGRLTPPQIMNSIYSIRGNTINVEWSQVEKDWGYFIHSDTCSMVSNDPINSGFLPAECSDACNSIQRSYNGYRCQPDSTLHCACK